MATVARSCLNMAFLVSVVLAAALVQNSAAQTTHVVGDALGWVIPPNGNLTYDAWAKNQTFAVGDSLRFNFATRAHDVAHVTKADFDACTTSNPILLENTGPATIKLNSSGEHYFICNFTRHCSLGQKLAINVSAAGTTSPSPSPSSLPPPPSSPSKPPVSSPAPTPGGSAPTPTPSGSRVTYVVGDTMGWAVPTFVGADASAYQTWAANKPFKVGDVLVFNYTAGIHDVAVVNKAAYDSCSNSTISVYTNPPTNITLNTTGEHFFICTYTGHCSGGQKLAINVTGAAATPTPTPAPAGGSPAGGPTPTSSGTPPPPSSSTPPSPSPSGGSSAPPPDNNSASSLSVAAASASFLSIFVAFFLG